MHRFDYKTKGKVLSIDHFSESNNLPLSFSSCSFILKHRSSERKIFRKLRLGAGIALQRPKPAALIAHRNTQSCQEKSRLAAGQMELCLQIALEVKWNRSFSIPRESCCALQRVVEDFERCFSDHWDRECTASSTSRFPLVGKCLLDFHRQQIRSLKR